MITPPNKPLLHRLVIYLPASEKQHETAFLAVESILCDRLGGATSFAARGLFRMAGGTRTMEKVQVVESYCPTRELEDFIPTLRLVAGIIGAALKQESIAFAIDGRMEFILPASGDSTIEWEGLTPSQFAESLMRHGESSARPGAIE